jgi:epoxyqueuosine reductase
MVQPLAAVLGGDPDPVVRAHAAWGLGRIGGSGARNALLEAQTSEQDPEALKEIATALRALEDAANTNAQSA